MQISRLWLEEVIGTEVPPRSVSIADACSSVAAGSEDGGTSVVAVSCSASGAGLPIDVTSRAEVASAGGGSTGADEAGGAEVDDGTGSLDVAATS